MGFQQKKKGFIKHFRLHEHWLGLLKSYLLLNHRLRSDWKNDQTPGGATGVAHCTGRVHENQRPRPLGIRVKQKRSHPCLVLLIAQKIVFWPSLPPYVVAASLLLLLWWCVPLLPGAWSDFVRFHRDRGDRLSLAAFWNALVLGGGWRCVCVRFAWEWERGQVWVKEQHGQILRAFGEEWLACVASFDWHGVEGELTFKGELAVGMSIQFQKICGPVSIRWGCFSTNYQLKMSDFTGELLSGNAIFYKYLFESVLNCLTTHCRCSHLNTNMLIGDLKESHSSDRMWLGLTF